MNEYDTNRIYDLAKTVGYEKTNFLESSDCYILNTCHIREKATEKVYHDVGRIKKRFRDKKKPILLVAGCVAQAEGEELIKRESYIDGVIGPQAYHEIPKIIKKIEASKKKIVFTDFDVVEKFDKLNQLKNNNSKTSAFLTIQEGCDKFCHFCVVPYTRGPEYSRSIDEIFLEAKQLENNGAKEITLLGQNVNAYLYEGKRLSDLIYLLNKLNGIKRIRYTTSHPKDVTQDLIDAYTHCNKLMPLLHLPVQSGSSKILKSMNRKHNIQEYFDTLEKLREAREEIKFSSDFIIGYPGENDDDFNDSVSLMKKVNFINSYSYLFSVRPGTPSAKLDLVDNNLANHRLEIFQNISNEIKQKYRKTLVNKNVAVLFENKLKNQDKYFGRDEHLNSVVVDSKIDLTGNIFKVKILDFNHNTLFGKIDGGKKDVAA